MDFYALQQIATVVGVIAPVAGAIYTWFATRNASQRKEIETIVKRLDAAVLGLQAAGTNAHAMLNIDRILAEHEKRLLGIEGEMKHLPAGKDVADLKLAISELSGTVGRLEEQLKGTAARLDEQVGSIGRTVHRIDDYLREKS
jgi:hypothetical protein